MKKFFFDLQDSICYEINKQEIEQFEIDDWNKSSNHQLKGSGRTRIIEKIVINNWNTVNHFN